MHLEAKTPFCSPPSVLSYAIYNYRSKSKFYLVWSYIVIHINATIPNQRYYNHNKIYFHIIYIKYCGCQFFYYILDQNIWLCLKIIRNIFWDGGSTTHLVWSTWIKSIWWDTTARFNSVSPYLVIVSYLLLLSFRNIACFEKQCNTFKGNNLKFHEAIFSYYSSFSTLK
jgi:hypothetical protein